MVIYKHYKKKEGNYIVVDMCKLQHTDDNWYDAVIYKELSSGMKFCRFESEFDNKFSAEEK